MPMNKFYIVSSDILPEVLEKVLEAQTLLQQGKVKRISEAVKTVGISRGTFYKYKDAVFSFSQESGNRKAIVNAIIKDQTGVLSQLLSYLASQSINILALNQTIPLNGIASLTLTMDISFLENHISELLKDLEQLGYVQKASLVAVE